MIPRAASPPVCSRIESAMRTLSHRGHAPWGPLLLHDRAHARATCVSTRWGPAIGIVGWLITTNLLFRTGLSGSFS